MSAAQPDSPDPVASKNDVLDYEGVVDRCMGKPELANRLIGKFLNSLDDEMARIKQLLEQRAIHCVDRRSQPRDLCTELGIRVR